MIRSLEEAKEKIRNSFNNETELKQAIIDDSIAKVIWDLAGIGHSFSIFNQIKGLLTNTSRKYMLLIKALDAIEEELGVHHNYLNELP